MQPLFLEKETLEIKSEPLPLFLTDQKGPKFEADEVMKTICSGILTLSRGLAKLNHKKPRERIIRPVQKFTMMDYFKIHYSQFKKNPMEINLSDTNHEEIREFSQSLSHGIESILSFEMDELTKSGISESSFIDSSLNLERTFDDEAFDKLRMLLIEKPLQIKVRPQKLDYILKEKCLNENKQLKETRNFDNKKRTLIEKQLNESFALLLNDFAKKITTAKVGDERKSIWNSIVQYIKSKGNSGDYEQLIEKVNVRAQKEESKRFQRSVQPILYPKSKVTNAVLVEDESNKSIHEGIALANKSMDFSSIFSYLSNLY